MTAYLLGPHWILCRSGSAVRVTIPDLDSESDNKISDHIHDSECVEDRPLVRWFAFPTDPTPGAELSILDLDNFAGCVGRT